jgi:hypothetical protein
MTALSSGARVVDVLRAIGDAAEVMGRDGYTAIPNDLIAASATVAALVKAAEGAEALIGVMFGDVNGRFPATVDTPIGVPVKIREIAAALRAALARMEPQS